MVHRLLEALVTTPPRRTGKPRPPRPAPGPGSAGAGAEMALTGRFRNHPPPAPDPVPHRRSRPSSSVGTPHVARSTGNTGLIRAERGVEHVEVRLLAQPERAVVEVGRADGHPHVVDAPSSWCGTWLADPRRSGLPLPAAAPTSRETPAGRSARPGSAPARVPTSTPRRRASTASRPHPLEDEIGVADLDPPAADAIEQDISRRLPLPPAETRNTLATEVPTGPGPGNSPDCPAPRPGSRTSRP